jgi:hypothetical protein
MKFNDKLLEGNNAGKLLEVNKTLNYLKYSYLIKEKIQSRRVYHPTIEIKIKNCPQIK